MDATAAIREGDSAARRFLLLLKTAARKWVADRAPQMGAALAYYAAFSIAPLLIVAVSIAGLAAGDRAVEGEIVSQLEGTLGEDTAGFVEGMVARARGGGGAGGTVLGLALGFFAASTLAVNLRRMLNAIWEIPHQEQTGLAAAVRTRVAGLAVVGGAALVVLAAMVASATLAAVSDFASAGPWLRPLLEVANVVAGIAVTACAFAALFRFLPATKVGWGEALLGGGVAAVLFTIGSWALARYIGSGAVGRGFGAAAALIVLLVFVYYSAQLLLYGAELAAVAGAHKVAQEEAVAAPRTASDTPAAPSTAGAFALGLLLGAWARRRSR